MPEGEMEIWLRARVEKLSQDLKKSATGMSESFAKSFTGVFRRMGVPVGLGAAATVGAVVTGLAMHIKGIFESIQKVYQVLKEASPTWKGMQETLKRMNNMILKPIGDMMSMLMRPYLMLMMRRLRAGLGAAGEVFKKMRAGVITPEQATEEIGDIVQGMLVDFGKLQFSMNRLLAPLAAQIDGFKAGVEAAIIDWGLAIKNLGAWSEGWFAGFTETLSPMSDELYTAIKDAAIAHPEILNQLGGDITSEWLKEATTDEALKDWADFPKDLRDEVVNAIILNRRPLEDLPQDISNAVMSAVMQKAASIAIGGLTGGPAGALGGAAEAGVFPATPPVTSYNPTINVIGYNPDELRRAMEENIRSMLGG